MNKKKRHQYCISAFFFCFVSCQNRTVINVCKCVNHSHDAEVLITINDVGPKDPLQFNTQLDLKKVIWWRIIVTLCCESTNIDFEKVSRRGEKHAEMNAFETFCHFVWLIELPIATYNILRENIDLTLSLSANLSYVVIVWVWCKNKQRIKLAHLTRIACGQQWLYLAQKSASNEVSHQCGPVETVWSPSKTLKCDASAVCSGACKAQVRTHNILSVLNG